MKSKKLLSLILCFALFLSLTAPVKAVAAETIVSEGAFDFKITAAGAEVIRYYVSGSSKVEVPSQVQDYEVIAIADEVFRNLDNITEIILPEGILTIGDRAFYACSDLERIALPESLMSIGEMAFCNCYALTALNIPKNVQTIGISAFQNCTALQSLEVAGENPYFKAVDSVLFSADMTQLLAYPNGKTNQTYTIPEQVLRIEEKAFLECSELQQVQFPSGLLEIDKYAFSGCTALEQVQLPDSVGIIGTFAFSGCTALTSVELGAGVTAVPAYGFSNCSSLKTVVCADQLQTIGNRAFYRCGTIEQLVITDSVQQIATDAFLDTRVTQVRFYSTAQKDVFDHRFADSVIVCLCKAEHTYLPADPANCAVCDYAMDLSKPPMLLSVTDTTVNLLTQEGFEYSYDQVNWRRDGVFTGLQPNRQYAFYARLAGGALPDQVSRPLEVTTDRSTQPQAPKPELQSADPTTITLKTVPGCEYSMDGTTWQSAPVFSGLQPDTAYTFFQRYTQSQTHYVGPVSQAATLKTMHNIRLSSQLYEIEPGLIHKIPTGTTVQTLLQGMEGGSYCTVFKNGTRVDTKTAVGTGMTLQLVVQGKVEATYTLLVTGDTNGDGDVTITDMLAVKAHILGKTQLTGVYAQVADTNGDGNITITDFLQIKAKILGKGTITAR